MQTEFRILRLQKRFPLRISRGSQAAHDNLYIGVSKSNVTGWGEMAPGRSEGAESAEVGREILQQFCSELNGTESIHETYAKGVEKGVPPCALAALDIALWDLQAKLANMPLYKLLGLGIASVPTSVTIGINPPDVVRERIPLLLDGSGVKSLKIKLGSPDGIDADQDMFQAVYEETRNYDVSLRVDANGGWSLDNAKLMSKWLKHRDVDYIEQPLAKGEEDQLVDLFKGRVLPIYVDESLCVSQDIPALAHCVDGVNLKLMKCGGITEALRIVATARAFGLKTMIGCMGESAISISAGAAIGALFDHIDLDSHLNLNPDPTTGAQLIDGVIVPTEDAGHGARFNDA
ncbi:MAG: L-alanine-DL-glutamate epimerase-like enolase superfamily enzyme [Parasphingorhabdus sp.]|jgi:L-alanine-DL-glutamate epimerase-like enolase superfamily enzyme